MVIIAVLFGNCTVVKPNAKTEIEPPYRVVYVMLMECKISQAMTPHLRDITEKYGPSGQFDFIAYFPESFLADDADLQQWAVDYDLSMSCLVDSNDQITQALGASRAPQVIVTNQHTSEILYSGRINNLFAALGKRRPDVTDHTLEKVLQQIIDGETVSPKTTEVIGCALN